MHPTTVYQQFGDNFVNEKSFEFSEKVSPVAKQNFLNENQFEALIRSNYMKSFIIYLQ